MASTHSINWGRCTPRDRNESRLRNGKKKKNKTTRRFLFGSKRVRGFVGRHERRKAGRAKRAVRLEERGGQGEVGIGHPGRMAAIRGEKKECSR